ncbi:MAG: D-2-hydroxyacid dehydrogenase [Roseiflexaceae bacterium]
MPTPPPTDTLNLLIATYLEPEYIEQIRAISPRLHVVYRPDLIPSARYAADHYNTITRTPEQEAEWRDLLAQADLMFDFDPTHRADLPELAPRVRWIQASSAGIGQFVHRQQYDTRMPQTIFTTASGIHARPLAEFCCMAILMFTRGALHTLQLQRQRRWERYAGTDLEGRTLGILGVGRIGAEVARMAGALGLRVIGTKRTIAGVDPASLFLDQLYPLDQLDQMLAQCDFFVIVTPHTGETERLIGAQQLAQLPRGTVLINIGRGAVVDEAALIAALQSGHLGGAALDVFEVEPLPNESPLWDLPNVLVSPHSGSTTDRENGRLVALYCENLRRYLAGEPLRNVLDTTLLY